RRCEAPENEGDHRRCRRSAGLTPKRIAFGSRDPRTPSTTLRVVALRRAAGEDGLASTVGPLDPPSPRSGGGGEPSEGRWWGCVACRWVRLNASRPEGRHARVRVIPRSILI